jgi:hypothetical protein
MTAAEIELYMRKGMDRRQLLAAGEHLAECAECQAKLSDAMDVDRRAAALRRALGEPEDHLSYESLAAYMDGQLDVSDELHARNHVEECEQCRVELQDLRRFRAEVAELQPSGVVRLWPLQRFRQWFHSPLAWAAIPAAAAALAGLVWILRGPALAPRPRLLASLMDAGHRVALDTSGKLTGVDRLPQADEMALRGALTTGEVQRFAGLQDLTEGTGALLRGAAEQGAFTVEEPVATMVAGDRPTFRWRPLAGADSYVVSVFRSDLKEVAHSPRLRQTTWTPEKPLPRGGTYTWQVAARKSGKDIIAPAPPLPEARFGIAGEQEIAELAREKQQFGDSHLLMGLAYARAGLMREAEGEFAALSRQNPGSPIAARLLESVREAK